MNVMDVTKAWFALISAWGTTNNVSKWKHDFSSALNAVFLLPKLV